MACMRQSVSEDAKPRKLDALGTRTANRPVSAPHFSETRAFDDRELRLVPLHPDHTQEWLELSSEEQLHTMTRIPRFVDEHAARQWMSVCWQRTCEPVSLRQTQTYIFAVVRSRGVARAGDAQLLGCVTLFRKGAAGYFSFWVGREHQGQGIGTRAARVAIRMAQEELKLRHLFAAAFQCNWVSQRVLSRVGWTLLPFCGQPPSEDLVFLHRPLTTAAALPQARLHSMFCRLLHDIGSDFVIAPISRSTGSGREHYQRAGV